MIFWVFWALLSLKMGGYNSTLQPLVIPKNDNHSLRMGFALRHCSHTYGNSGFKIKRRRKNRRGGNLHKRKDRAKKFALKLIEGATPAELAFKKALDDASILYDFQRPFYDHETTHIVDFYLPRGKQCGLIVEIDGEYHESRVESDENRTQWLEKNTGATVLRFTNEQVFNELTALIHIIQQAVKITNQSRNP